MAFLYVKNENDALDVVQEAVYKAYISIEQLKELKYFSTWITRILINVALDFIEKSTKVISMDQEVVERIESHAKFPLEDKMDLLQVIEQLEEKYKTVIILRYYEDFSVKQIAELLGYPEGTVKTNLHRALKKLKLEFKEACVNE
ncbi:sigma-70 family RNA polymerase sigma factor [Viridibacillus soli]|uniref:sigma-70 family RNA polymerase sigma factor n=1 Tax=Viridibacillus soli TaxID=2798301 RepID=UPI001F2584F1|nr:sigma-70 family RNA polymerase sigma factor [Viridibacillus soli]